MMVNIIKALNIKTVLSNDKGIRKFIMMIFGVLLIGFGVSVFSYSDMGVDPFTSMNMAISAKTGISFGFYQMCINIIILVFIAVFAKKLISIGTVFNMLSVGYICELFTAIFNNFLPQQNSQTVKIILMIFGVCILSLGASLYFTSDLGVAPYDAIGFVLNDKSKIAYKWCRVITDLVCAVIGFIFAGPVGAGTIVTAFMMGPVISFFNKNVSEKLLNMNIRMPVMRFYNLKAIGGGVVAANGRFAS